MTETSQLKKIVILGGGMSSLTTAFELTNQPNWNAMYDITIYQLGWRLGGKCASGRNIEPSSTGGDPNYRIEEHGLHIFFGFYENAFRLIKQCYDELGEDNAFTSVIDAFQPHDLVVLEEYFQGRWIPWVFNFPENELRPWQGGNTDSLWDHICTTIEFIYETFKNLSTPAKNDTTSFTNPLQIGLDILGLASENWTYLIEPIVQWLLQEPQHWLKNPEKTTQQIQSTLKGFNLSSEAIYLHLAHQLAQSLPDNPQTHRREHHLIIVQLLDKFMQGVERKYESAMLENDALRKDLIVINFGYANTRGILLDEILFHQSLDVLDEQDYQDWLKKQGAWDITITSPPVRALYDLVYAYPNGNVQQPQLSTAIAIRGYVSLIFRYNGAIMWKMQAGMGDTIVAPLYNVLKRRGVKFKFFHNVKNLHLTPDQTAIEQITLGRQVTLKDPQQDYHPLIKVKRLLCWPNEPLYEQIVDSEAEKLKSENINLESFWTPWQDVETFTLEMGKDFDLIVLGISIAALKYICPELIEANPKWQKMLDKVQTVSTQGGQIWLKPNLRQLGWTLPSAVMGTYVEPLDTYADMSHLIEQENWSSQEYPYNLAYFTGVMEDPGIPPQNDYDFPKREQQKLDDRAINFLTNQIGYIWPNATPSDNPQGLDWNLLVDTSDSQGEERFYSQFWRINIFPTERYVLSVPGSTQYRLKADESGFDNLYITGDWINNGFNAGAVEPTVMSGMQTARAVLKQFQVVYPKTIVNEWDAWI